MKNVFLVIVRKDQMDSVSCTKIITALKASKRITTMEQVTFRELESSPVGAANLSALLKVSHVCYLGLKVGAMVPLINKIDLTNKNRGVVQHLILRPDGPIRDLTKWQNVQLYETHEKLAEEPAIKAIKLPIDESIAVV